MELSQKITNPLATGAVLPSARKLWSALTYARSKQHSRVDTALLYEWIKDPDPVVRLATFSALCPPEISFEGRYKEGDYLFFSPQNIDSAWLALGSPRATRAFMAYRALLVLGKVEEQGLPLLADKYQELLGSELITGCENEERIALGDMLGTVKEIRSSASALHDNLTWLSNRFFLRDLSLGKEEKVLAPAQGMLRPASVVLASLLSTREGAFESCRMLGRYIKEFSQPPHLLQAMREGEILRQVKYAEPSFIKSGSKCFFSPESSDHEITFGLELLGKALLFDEAARFAKKALLDSSHKRTWEQAIETLKDSLDNNAPLAREVDGPVVKRLIDILDGQGGIRCKTDTTAACCDLLGFCEDASVDIQGIQRVLTFHIFSDQSGIRTAAKGALNKLAQRGLLAE